MAVAALVSTGNGERGHSAYAGIRPDDIVGLYDAIVNIDVLELDRVVFFLCRLNRRRLGGIFSPSVMSLKGRNEALTAGICRRRRRKMVLEQHVVFMRCASDAPEDLGSQSVL